MSTTTVTKLIPVTVEYDGCFCSDECKFKQNSDCKLPFLGHWWCTCMIDMKRVQSLYYVVPRKIKLPKRLKYAHVRTRECCETFGMGEDATEQPEAMGDYELETMDAKDAEALRRWTSE